MILNLNELGIASAYKGLITFLGETAGFRNTLGMYHIAADGAIYDVQIVFSNASQEGGGGNLKPGASSVGLQFDTADSIGFFILPDSISKSTANLLSMSTGHYEFRTAAGTPASVNDKANPTLYYVDAAGVATAIKTNYGTTTFHSAASADNNFALNGDSFNHVRFSVEIKDGKALLTMAFEDLWGGGDKNFNDVMFRLDIGAVNTVALAPEIAPLMPVFLGTSNDEAIVSAKGTTTMNLLANDAAATADKSVHITHLDGIAVNVGDTITLDGGDRLTLGKNGLVTVEGTATSHDVLVNYLIGDAKDGIGSGTLTLHVSPVDGTEGNDQMGVGYADKDGNTIDGKDGLSDVIMGYGGDDKITAGLGNDNIYGGSGNDFIRAGAGNDLLDGGSGNDVLDGQAGADTMSGGLGDDVYYIDNLGDVVSESAGAGYDKVKSEFTHVLGANFEELWLIEGSAAADGTGNTLDNKLVGNGNANHLFGLGGADQLFGEDGDDSVDGGNGADNLFGGLGNDLLLGGSGSDKLYGGGGHDTLSGGLGNDSLTSDGGDVRLIGGEGNDLLAGGSGVDVFVFALGDGKDTVKNFQHGRDVLEFSGLTFDDLTIQAVGSTVRITDCHGDLVILADTNLSQIDHHDFIFV